MRHRQLFQTYMFADNLGADLPQVQISFKKQTAQRTHTHTHAQTRMHALPHTDKQTYTAMHTGTDGRNNFCYSSLAAVGLQGSLSSVPHFSSADPSSKFCDKK